MPPLYVITVISNPVRFRSRYDLYRNFEKHMQQSGVILYTVELAYGERAFEITDTANPCHIQIRGEQEFWHKENLMNIGLSRLPDDAKYVAWIDADVSFVRPDWAQETVHQLQHYDIVQLFTHAQDLGPNFEPMQLHTGFVYKYLTEGWPKTPANICVDEAIVNFTGHPGYAWAARRETLEKLNGFLDYAILGSGDNHMARSFIGRVETSFYTNINPNYKRMLFEWQAACKKYVNGNIGYVKTTINHYWHGKKRDRGYVDRWKILADNNFDPVTDLRKNNKGLYVLALDDKPKFRDQLRAYFRSRNEDSVDI